jgi:hypothetical protein
MCTLALYFQEFKDYPMIVAANRDEFMTRPSASPQVLIESPLIFGGKDLLAGGTWLGVNERGLLAGIVNRRSAAEKEHPELRSRGLLCLDVLKAKSPAEARALLTREKGSNYQPFNLLFANADEAYVAHNEKDQIECAKLPKGLHVIGNTSIYDSGAAKTTHAHTLFSDAAQQIQKGMEKSFFKRWFGGGLPVWDQPAFLKLFKGILSNHMLRAGSKDPKGAICVHAGNYGTVSSSVIFYMLSEKRFFYHQTLSAPCRSEYETYLSIEVADERKRKG